MAFRRYLYVTIDDDFVHGTPFHQGELLAMPPITIEIKEMIPQRLVDKDVEQLLATRWDCPHLGGFRQDLIIELCIGILHAQSSVLVAVLSHCLALCEHYGVVAQTTTELQGIVLVQELPAEAKFAIHEDVLRLVEVQAVVLLTFHFPVVIVMVCSSRPEAACACASGAAHSRQGVTGVIISDGSHCLGIVGAAPRRS